MAKEYIEREALLQRLSCNPDIRFIVVADTDGMWINGRDAISVIREATTADVVEVVRCGECKSWCPCSSGKAGTCKGKVRGITKPEDFCSYGKRRDNNAAD